MLSRSEPGPKVRGIGFKGQGWPSDHLFQQPDHLSLLGSFQRNQRFRRDPVSNGDRFFGDATSGPGQRDHAAAAISRIAIEGHQLTNAQAVDHAFDGGGVQIDQTSEMILRTCPDFGQLGQRSELGLGQTADHPRCENGRVPLHGDPHEKADLVLHDITARDRGSGRKFSFDAFGHAYRVLQGEPNRKTLLTAMSPG